MVGDLNIAVRAPQPMRGSRLVLSPVRGQTTRNEPKNGTDRAWADWDRDSTVSHVHTLQFCVESRGPMLGRQASVA